jgi:hypothetical protein
MLVEYSDCKVGINNSIFGYLELMLIQVHFWELSINKIGRFHRGFRTKVEPPP